MYVQNDLKYPSTRRPIPDTCHWVYYCLRTEPKNKQCVQISIPELECMYKNIIPAKIVPKPPKPCPEGNTYKRDTSGRCRKVVVGYFYFYINKEGRKTLV